jgi:hypothetical protein
MIPTKFNATSINNEYVWRIKKKTKQNIEITVKAIAIIALLDVSVLFPFDPI